MTKTPASPSPGPWADPERPERDVFEPHNGHTTTPEDYLAIHIGEGNELEGENYITVHGPNQEANAKLVAAAPEMLEALRMAEQFAGLPHMDDAALQMCIDRGLDHEKGLGKGKAAFTLSLRAIIRKAEGKS